MDLRQVHEIRLSLFNFVVVGFLLRWFRRVCVRVCAVALYCIHDTAFFHSHTRPVRPTILCVCVWLDGRPALWVCLCVRLSFVIRLFGSVHTDGVTDASHTHKRTYLKEYSKCVCVCVFVRLAAWGKEALTQRHCVASKTLHWNCDRIAISGGKTVKENACTSGVA